MMLLMVDDRYSRMKKLRSMSSNARFEHICDTVSFFLRT